MTDKKKKGETEVIFDTNSLMIPSQFGVDVFDEVERLIGGYKPVVPKPVADELRKMSESNSNAGLALELVKRCDVVEKEGYADDVIVELAKDENHNQTKEKYVVTNDTDLKNRLLEVGVPVLYLRQKSYLEIKHP